VIVHQHPGEDLPSAALRGFSHRAREQLPIRVVEHDRLPVVASRHDMVAGVLELDSGRSRHYGPKERTFRQSRNVDCPLAARS